MTDSKPDWLPNLLKLMPWKSNTYEILYKLFQIDFIKSRPIYRGKKISIPLEKEDDKEKLFWHLVSKEEKESGERLPDLCRSERLLWTKPAIEHVDEPEIIDWDDEDNKKRIITYVWLKEYDFIVIMKKLKNEKRLLLTAYCIEYNHTRRYFERKYRNRII